MILEILSVSFMVAFVAKFAEAVEKTAVEYEQAHEETNNDNASSRRKVA